MTEKYTMGVEVNMNTKQQTSTARVVSSSAPETRADSPFCIAILSDFTARSTSKLKLSPLSDSRLIEIDRDNLEEVMAKLNIQISLELGNEQSVSLVFKELEDFHPDQLYNKLDSFAELRSLRRRLNNKKTFPDAADEIQSWAEMSDSHNQSGPIEESVDKDINMREEVDQSSLLNNILDSQQGTQTTDNEVGQIHRLIRSIVAPYVEPAADPRQEEMLSVLDNVTEKHMQDILHHEGFRQIESAWLSLNFLVRRLETGSKLKLFIMDISKQELQNELANSDNNQTILFKRFCDPAEGDRPWSLIVGNYIFNDSIEDVKTLEAMGEIAQAANAPFISDVSPHFSGCDAFVHTPDYEDWNYSISDDVSEAWNNLRSSTVSNYIGLSLPRFLLRLPYGEKAKQVEVFNFEEMPVTGTPENNHENYLWGHAAILKTELLARSFLKNGWAMRPGEVYQIENLPLHYYAEDGETVNKPVAEIYLTEKAGEKLTSQGLMPLWSVKNMDAIRSTDFRSINLDTNNLKGRWAEI